MQNLSHIKIKIGYYYLFIALAFCAFVILDVCFLMAWWEKFFGYGLLLIAAALHPFIEMTKSRQLMDENRRMEATLKIRRAGCKIHVLALTASAMKGDRERFLEVGMDGYLSNPINVNILEDVF